MSSRSSWTSSPCRWSASTASRNVGRDQVGERARDRLGRLELVHELERVVLGRVGLDAAAVFLASPRNRGRHGLCRGSSSRPDRHLVRLAGGRLAAIARRPARSSSSLTISALWLDRGFQAVAHEVARGQHPRLVRGVGVSLGEDRQPVPQADVGRAVPGLGRIGRPLGVVAVEVPVVERFQVGPLLEAPR